jgi:hypothetical protein
MHEIGHLLGLGHSEVGGSIMKSGQSANFFQHTLSEDDINGLSITMPPIPASGKFHYITPALAPYKVLDVRAQSTANGAPIQLWDALRLRNQSFRAEYMAYKGAFRFRAEHSGKVLDVSGASKDDGAEIVQWDWHGGDNQLFWVVNPRGTTQQWIMAVHSRKVLDVAGGSQANGAKIQQWTPIEIPPRNQLFS